MADNTHGSWRLLGSGALRLVLLAIVIGECVFLASRYGARLDLTADGAYTPTPVTQRVLSRIEDRLLVEAWFSPDDTLATGAKESRATLRAFLDELVQRGGGRVVVQYFDPQSDVALRRKAERLGIRPQVVQDIGGTTLSNIEVWQGLRFRYGGERQRVVPYLGFSERTGDYERALTPLVKALTLAEKPKIGLIQWPMLAPENPIGMARARKEPAPRFDRLRQSIEDRYDVIDVTIAQGQHIPDDIPTLVLVRPHGLTDRQKYVFDQFLMRGGRLIVFADGEDVSLGSARRMLTRRLPLDAPGSERRFADQLSNYGLRLGDRFLMDAGSQVPQSEGFRMRVQQAVAQQITTTTTRPIPYPYYVRPLDVNWGERAANELARNPNTGEIDTALANRFREEFDSGVDPVAKRVLVGATFFWPVAVDAQEVPPDNVTARTLFRTSPRSLERRAPSSVSPVGDDDRWQVGYQQFRSEVESLFRSEPAQQHGLVVELVGEFPSAFDGADIPLPPHLQREKKADEEDPLKDPVGSDPLKDEKQPQDAEGPELPESPLQRGDDDEPEMIVRAPATARLIVVGDSDFVRDDLTDGRYGQIGGPLSVHGLAFFASLIDWINEDPDLMELMGKQFADRSIRLMSAEERTVLTEESAESAKAFGRRLRYANILLPPIVLVTFGIVLALRRRGNKKAFLQEQQG